MSLVFHTGRSQIISSCENGERGERGSP